MKLHLFDKATQEKKKQLTECIKVLVKQADEMPETRRDKHGFDYNYVHPDTGYSTLHWLAYWNDAESINTILSNIELHKESDEDVLRTLSATDTDKSGSFGSGDMTAITIAGERDNIKALKAYMDFFKRNVAVITELFGQYEHDSNEFKQNDDKYKRKDYAPMKEMRAIKPKSHTLKVFSVGESSGINSDKIYYAAEIFYWATFIGDIEIVNLFFIHLGFSPFINLFRGQSPVHAAALSGNGKLFEYLVKGSSHGFREVHIKGGNRRTRAKHSKGCPDLFQGREDPEKNRFMFLSEEDREKF